MPKIKKYSFDETFSESAKVNSKLKKGYLRGKEITFLLDSIQAKSTVAVERRSDGSLKWMIDGKPILFSYHRLSNHSLFYGLKRIVHKIKIKVLKSERNAFNDKIIKIEKAFQNIKLESKSITSSRFSRNSSVNEKEKQERQEWLVEKAKLKELKKQQKELNAQTIHLEITIQENQEEIDQLSRQKNNDDTILMHVNFLRARFQTNWFGNTFLDDDEKHAINELISLTGKKREELDNQVSLAVLYDELLGKDCKNQLSDLLILKEAHDSALKNLQSLWVQAQVDIAKLEKDIGEESLTSSLPEETSSSSKLGEEEQEINWDNDFPLTDRERVFYDQLSLEEKRLYRILAEPVPGHQLSRLADLFISLVIDRNLKVIPGALEHQYEIHFTPGNGVIHVGNILPVFGEDIPIMVGRHGLIQYIPENRQWKMLEGGPEIIVLGTSLDLTGAIFQLNGKRMQLFLDKTPKVDSWTESVGLKLGLKVLSTTGIGTTMALNPGFIEWK